MNNIQSISKYGTNSTMFTLCCGCAICDDQKCCPACGEEIIGADAKSSSERRRIRWNHATRLWARR